MPPDPAMPPTSPPTSPSTSPSASPLASPPGTPPGAPPGTTSGRQLGWIAAAAVLSVLGAMAAGVFLLGRGGTSTATAPLPAVGDAPLSVRVDGVPLWVVRVDAETVDVFWARSPSVDGAVDWVPRDDPRWDAQPGMPGDDGFFADLRTGARWRRDGSMGWGPTFRDLDRFTGTVRDGLVHVDLDRVLRGVCDPGVAVRDRCSTPGAPAWERGPAG